MHIVCLFTINSEVHDEMANIVYCVWPGNTCMDGVTGDAKDSNLLSVNFTWMS